MYKRVIAAILVVLLARCSRGPVRETRDLTFQTSDGVTIAATLYVSKNEKPAGLILVPMLGASRARWAPFAEAARAEGYQCIAIDMRGHGGSTQKGPQKLDYDAFTTDDWLDVEKDIAAAKKALLDSGADPENIGIAGASIGANLALQYAVKDDDIQALVLLSPGLDYHGVGTEDAIQALDKRPVLLMTAIGDAYSAQTCAALKPMAQGHCELREYDGTSHGTDLLDTHDTATGQVLLWLSAIIGPEAAAANRRP